MKFALIGTGKTGRSVQGLLRNEEIGVTFNTQHPVDVEILKKFALDIN